MEFQKAAEGLEFPEGPVAMADGSVLVVELKRQTLTRITPDGTRIVVAELGGAPNGAAIGPDGAAYICNNGGLNWRKTAEGLTATNGTPDDYRSGSIQRVDLSTGAFTTLYEECDGVPLRSPNDIVFDSQGGFWFTDMGKVLPDMRYHGAICYASTDGSKIVRASGPMVMPNGIGLSPDEKTLYVSETITGRFWAFDIEAPGVLKAPSGFAPGRLLLTMPDFQLFDSLAVQADGKVCLATCISGGITICDPHRGKTQFIEVPGEPFVTNLCFGGPDMRDVWITSSGQGLLLHARWPEPGLALSFNA